MDNNVEKFRSIANELGDLYEKKNNAYGNSFGDTYKKLGIISAVTRISDKYNRLCNLATNPDIDNLGESIEDTLKDLASYAIMTLMEIQIKKVAEPNSINVGDKFLCKKTVVMDSSKEVAYEISKVYGCKRNSCITDEQGRIDHLWLEEDNWQDYFTKIK